MEKIILESDVLIVAEFVFWNKTVEWWFKSNSKNKFNASPGLRALGIY